MKRRIVPGGILALSLAVVLLAATASGASAQRVLVPWYCPPPPTLPTTIEQVQECIDRGPAWWDSATGLPVAGSFDFGDRQVGTTSSAQRFALGVWDNDSFNPRISVSGDYAQTNSCPPTLSAPEGQIQGCLITVTFTPTGTGPRHGTLSTGPGGPTAGLAGNGVTTPTPSPDLQLSGKEKQHPTMRSKGCGPHSPSTDCSVKVKASCGADACTARAEGKLTKVNRPLVVGPNGVDVRPHETRTLKLRMTKKTREKALKAIDKGKNVQARVTVRATDAAGNVATAKRTITLK